MAFDVLGRIGLRFVKISVAVGIGGSFLYKSVPHLCPQTVCRYFFDTGEEVPEKCLEEFQTMARKMDLKDPDNVVLFVNRTLSGFSAGSTSLPNGAVIGIPRNYIFDTEDDVEKADFRFKDRAMKWDSELGIKFKKALIPTRDNIAFNLGHEISHLKNPEYRVLYSFLPPAWMYFSYRAIGWTNRLSNITLFVEFLLKMCLLKLSHYGYQYVVTEIHHYEEYLADANAAKVSLDTARGGIDGLRKDMLYNQSMRALHGNVGEEYFDRQGNELKEYFHPTKSDRIRKLEDIIAELSNSLR